MNQNDEKFLKIFFSTDDGTRILNIIRTISGYDNRTQFISDERLQMYNLGRADLYSTLQKIISTKSNNNGKSNNNNNRKSNRTDFGSF